MPRRGWASRNAAGFARRGGQEVAASMPLVVHYRRLPGWSECDLRLGPDDLATDDPREVTCPTCLRAAPHIHPFRKGVWPNRCAERVMFHGLQQDCGRPPAHPIHHL